MIMIILKPKILPFQKELEVYFFLISIPNYNQFKPASPLGFQVTCTGIIISKTKFKKDNNKCLTFYMNTEITYLLIHISESINL